MPRVKKQIEQKTKKDNLSVDILGIDGTKKSKLKLPEEIFAGEAKPALLAQAVRVFLANQRRGTHSTKTRTQVSGSTRKIYRQKGTGRARHGDIKAPIFIGGGIAHGPKPRDYSLILPKKMRRKALFAALKDKFTNGKMLVVDSLESIGGKTKEMISLLKNINVLTDKDKKEKQIMLVMPEFPKEVILATRNIKGVVMRPVRLLNAYEILAAEIIVLTKQAIAKLIETSFETEKKLKVQKVAVEKPSKPVVKKVKKVKLPKAKVVVRKKKIEK